ncbi:hypothetical protein BDZ91DRAFT_333962 [Kalaharituber pfeilii]|nr:hypothetical protein BDZ91DRAFT_333962 [Kalaharituber pfeilii]
MFGNNGSNTDSASATILTPSSSEYNSHHQQVPPNQQVPPTLWGQYRGSCFVAQHSTSDHPAETSRKQPTVTDEREPEPGVETWSNAATTGTGPDWDDNAAPMSREMDFRNEFERLRYLMGAGLPAYGFDAEARLLRAINMNHYILVGHVSESLENTTKALYLGLQREIAESHNTLFLELQDIKAKLGSSPPSREAPYIPPQRPQFSARQPTDEQDSEIEQLWAQSRILKEENVTLAKELAERKEVEDLQVTELLYQNKIIENMHAKSREMAKELASCWREIKKLQDTVKVMEGALATKPKKETIALTGGKPKLGSTVTPVPAKLAVEDNLQQLLDKINDGIEKLADTDYSRTANSKKESLPDQANKDGSVQSNTDECECELCERARAKKNIGVGNQPPQFETSIVKGKEPESVVIYSNYCV